MDGRLQCDVANVQTGELRTVTVRGEVDLATASDLESFVRSALVEAPDGVVLDLAQLTFIDSSGLRVLVALAKDAESRGTALALRNLPRHAQRVFELTGLGDWFEVT
jgi:anti-sigma B factor antagonist